MPAVALGSGHYTERLRVLSLCVSLTPILTLTSNYGRPLSVSGRPCYILPMFLFYFFMAALFSGPGERRFAKVLHVVDLECHWRSYYLDFFLVILKLQGGPKSDEISHILKPRPQTFCSHARTRQNIVILKKNLLSTDGFSTTYATFGELWSTNPWDPRDTKFLKNDTRE